MEFINSILTFPGKISAYFLADHISNFAVFLAVLTSALLGLGFARKRRECYYLALILTSLLLTVIPYAFGSATYYSSLFWGCTFLSAIIGFVYHFLDQDLEAGLARSDEDDRGDGLRSLFRYPGGGPAGDGRFRTFFKENPFAALAVLLVLMACYLRLFQIEQYPNGYSFWELDKALDFIKYDLGLQDFKYYLSLFKFQQINVSKQSPIMMALAYPFFKIFGIHLVTGRYCIVPWGLAGLFFLYLFLRCHFSWKASVLLVSLVSLELVNVIFGRTGLQNITSFTYAAFVLYFMELTFTPKKLYQSIPMAILFGLVVFGTFYMYLSTRAVIPAVLMILAYRAVFTKRFFSTNRIPLMVFPVTLLAVVWIYTGGQFTELWPDYTGYLSVKESGPAFRFIVNAYNTFTENFMITFNRIVFSERAADSLSKFKEGGLLSGPALCLAPFAIGYSLAGIRKNRYATLLVVISVALLPGILSGIPNARRLLMFLSFSLVLPGITLYALFDLIQRLLEAERKRLAVLAPAAFLLFLFSYNLFIFIDINMNMVRQNSVAIPFADSGFLDTRYSRYVTVLAKRVGEWVKKNNIYYYYSNSIDEDPTSPKSFPDQLMIESYENGNQGGKLIWLNNYAFATRPVRDGDRVHFSDFEEALKMIRNSDRDVKLLTFKPLGDELSIFMRLKAAYPGTDFCRETGDIQSDVFYALTIPHDAIEQTNAGPATAAAINSIFYPYRWSIEKTVSYNRSVSAHTFYYTGPGRYLYSYYDRLFDDSGQEVTPVKSGLITREVQRAGKTYVIYAGDIENGLLAVFDSNYKKVKDIKLDGYPFDLFFGASGELYITYLNRNRITILRPDNQIEDWDTASFSDFPIWNGDVDRNGDIVLLNADQKVFVFDQTRRRYKSFFAGAGWAVATAKIRIGGGLIVTDGIIHILNSRQGTVGSYDKNGDFLFNKLDDSLVEIPPGFNPGFVHRWRDRIVLTSLDDNDKRILTYRYDKASPSDTIQKSVPLVQLKPVESNVGWGALSYHVDQGRTGTINNETYKDSVFAHAPSRVSYGLNRQYKTFSFGYGLDDMDGNDKGSVVFIVKGDGRFLFISPVVHAMSPIARKEVSVEGIKTLELIVDPTPDGKAFDQSVWVEPVLHP